MAQRVYKILTPQLKKFTRIQKREQMILVYKTDNWHTYDSRDLIGVAKEKSKALDICEQHAKKEGETFTDDDIYNLNNLKQTQGYNGEGEFAYEEVETDKLL